MLGGYSGLSSILDGAKGCGAASSLPTKKYFAFEVIDAAATSLVQSASGQNSIALQTGLEAAHKFMCGPVLVISDCPPQVYRGNLNATRYQDEVLVDVQQVGRSCTPKNAGWTLMQDLAPAHNAAYTRQFLLDRGVSVALAGQLTRYEPYRACGTLFRRAYLRECRETRGTVRVGGSGVGSGSFSLQPKTH